MHKLFAPVRRVKMLAQVVCAKCLARFKKFDTRRTASKRVPNFLRSVNRTPKTLRKHVCTPQTLWCTPKSLRKHLCTLRKHLCTPQTLWCTPNNLRKHVCTPQTLWCTPNNLRKYLLHSANSLVHSKPFAQIFAALRKLFGALQIVCK